MTAAIEIDHLTKRYRGTTAVSGLSLEVPAGSIVGFLGPNGAGKTTTLKILAGLTRATSGAASVNGISVSAAGAHRTQVGYLAQEPRFYAWMSGRQTLNYVASFFGRPRAARVEFLAGTRRPDRRRGSTDRHLFGRHAAAAGHRPGPRR